MTFPIAFALYIVAAAVLIRVLGGYTASLSIEYPPPPVFDRELAYRTLLGDPTDPTNSAPATDSGNELRHND